jgi:UDP-3-O-[3-hydroxymyristoyl] glucosamine N-acyltransferase
MAMTLGVLAVRHGCELRGDPDTVVDHVATLSGASTGGLAFLANPLYRSQLAATKAAAVVLAIEDVNACPAPCLVSTNPYLTYARIAAELHPSKPPQPGVGRGAQVSEGSTVPGSCCVEPGAFIGRASVLGERVSIGANAVVGSGCTIGCDTRIMAGVVLYDRVRVGRRCLIHSGAIIGADGFGIARESSGTWTKVPQLGTVVIGDDVEIGANTTIDRGAIDDTVIGNGVKLDNQIQVGHNVVIGEHTVVAGMVGIAGSTRIGARCIIGGAAGISGHLSIADDVVISGGAQVTRSIDEAGLYGGAIPAAEAARWRKNVVRFGQLEELARRIRHLESAIRARPRSER